MQDQYDCFFFIADWHALTTDYADTSRLKENSVEVLLDWLAAGLDPESCMMFIQSHVPAARGTALAVFDDHSARLAGARPDLQGTEGEHQGERPDDIRISWLSRAAVGGHFDLQGGLRPGRRRPGGACGTDARDRTPVQRLLRQTRRPSSRNRSPAHAAPACPAPTAARCRSPTATRSC